MHTTSVTLLERLRWPETHQAWERFVSLYTPLLYYWARRLGLQEPDAADLVQDVFAVLIHKLPEFAYDARRSFRNWLRTVLRNKWHEHQRRRAVPTHSGDAGLSGVASTDDVFEVDDVEFQQHVTIRALQLMQAEFQPTTWKACWEQVVKGRSAEDVAGDLDITANAAYLAKGRVLRRLRQEFAGLLD